MDLTKIISESIKSDIITKEEIESLLTTAREGFGDYALPCFSLSKKLHKSPMDIANELKDCVKSDKILKCETVAGYLNFYLNPEAISKEVLENELTLGSTEFKGKTMCIDYSSVNLAKYMHIGHLATTLIGESISRIYEALGYKVVRMNYIGDYGTPFGKIITAIRLWGDENKITEGGIDYLQSLYVKFCSEEETNPELMPMARQAFKEIEEKNPNTYPLFEKVIKIAKSEVEELTKMLGIKFDDWTGESYYNDKMQPAIEECKQKGLLIESEGCWLVDLNEYNLGVCILQKSDGTSLYATRDITAAQDRYNKYNFDELIYVTAVQQRQHFASFFKVLELMGKPFADRLKHVYYGMFSLPSGKIASRRGKQAVVRDILEVAVEKATDAIKDRDFTEEEKVEVAKKVAMGAISFLVLKNERVKDNIFDIDRGLSFDGDTAPYLQYTYARCASILRKYEASEMNKNVEPDFSVLNNEEAFSIVKFINNFNNLIYTAKEKYEPSIISKSLLEFSAYINKMYHEYKIIDENERGTKARILLIEKAKQVLKYGMNLVVIETIEKM